MKKKSSIVFISSASIIILAGTGYYFFNQKQDKNLSYSSEQLRLIDKDVLVLKQEFDLQNDFNRQVNVGYTMPVLPFKSFSGTNSPDWNKPMLLTFGSEFSPNVKSLYAVLDSTKLQLVHVVYPRSWITPDDNINLEEVREFGGQTAVLDASNKDVSGAFFQEIGVYHGGYAFILDGKRRILYASNDIGLSIKNTLDAVNSYMNGNVPKPNVLVRNINSKLPLNDINTEVRQSIKEVMKKPKSLVIIKASKECDICGVSMDNAIEPVLERMQTKNIGIAVIDVNREKYSYINKSGIIYISDPMRDSIKQSDISKLWNVRAYPSIYVFKNGEYVGEVLYRSWEFSDGKNAEHIQALAAERILQ